MTEKENYCCDLAQVERGAIVAAEDGLYTVKSYGRSGLTTPGIPALHPTLETYTVGDNVYFFVFGDGTGAVIGKF